jgi:hypothetical protein
VEDLVFGSDVYVLFSHEMHLCRGIINKQLGFAANFFYSYQQNMVNGSLPTQIHLLAH